jgi:RND family efflux transporter MFP subunit
MEDPNMNAMELSDPATRNGHTSTSDLARQLDGPAVRHTRWPWRPALVVLGVVVLFGALLTVGLLPRLREREELEAETAEVRSTPPAVNVITAKRNTSTATVDLPGSARAFQETAVYARTNGYLKRWLVDLGGHVKAGQLLAEIETPEIDQQLAEARATLEQSIANVATSEAKARLAVATHERYQRLVGNGAVSKQDFDTSVADADSTKAVVQESRARVRTSEAAVRRLEEMQRFQKVVAPFAGILSARNVDRGALISATGGVELFHLVQVDPLRVYVPVPQNFSVMVHEGQDADVRVREHPGRTFHGKVTRTAGALDPSSRTLMAEVQVPNGDAALMPGMYVRVLFQMERSRPPVIVPGAALVVGREGVRVAIIEGTKLHYRTVELGRDYGNEVEVLSGLDGGETVAVNLTGEIAEGVEVRPVRPVAEAK